MTNTHGGARPGSGRKSLDGKRVMVILDADTLDILDTVRAQLGWSRSRAIRELVQQADHNLSRKLKNGGTYHA